MKKLMTSDDASSEDALLCPMCGVEVGLHITKVETLTGKYSLVANSRGIKTNPEPSKAALGNRGVIVKLYLACEICGHVGSIDFAFHKGMVFVNCEDLGEDIGWCDLWRD
jgi:hypothetical protein